MHHGLILVTGTSPGIGKSTLSRLLFEQLEANDIPARWLHEEDIVAAFEQFVPGMTAEPTPDAFLEASSALADSCRTEKAALIIDSYLPGFHHVYGRYTDDQIEAFSVELRSILDPLQPLVIYLRSDAERALMRGVRQRGSEWLENITRFLHGWQLPHYGGVLKPLRTVPDVISFFMRTDRLAVELLAQWPNSLILDANETPSLELLETVLQTLHLAHHTHDRTVPHAELGSYVGVYLPWDEERALEPLSITVVGDDLFVNVYWPAGTRLLPEGGARFQLEGTNRHIAFDVDADGPTSALTYSYGNTGHRYKKRL